MIPYPGSFVKAFKTCSHRIWMIHCFIQKWVLHKPTSRKWWLDFQGIFLRKNPSIGQQPQRLQKSERTSRTKTPPQEKLGGGGFKYFLFSPLPGEDFQFDEYIFHRGWFNHPTRKKPDENSPENERWPLKIDGWKTILSFWVSGYFNR